LWYEIYLIYTQRSDLFLFLHHFRGQLKVYLDDANVNDSHAYRIHAVCGRSDEDALTSWHNPDAYERIDELVGTDGEEDMVQTW
jgi:hypothetical protein